MIPWIKTHLFNCPTYFLKYFLNHLCNICYSITKVIKNKQGYSLKDAPCSYNILCSNLSSLLRFFYLSFQVQLLHFLVAVSYSNEGARLWLLLSATIPFHLLFFFLPSTAHKIHTWRRTKEPENEKCIMRLHIAFKKILETKTVMYPKLSQPICTLHSSLYMQALHLPCRLSKMQTRKEKKQGKWALDALSIFPVHYMIGNSLHLCNAFYPCKEKILNKSKRPWKCFAFVDA